MNAQGGAPASGGGAPQQTMPEIGAAEPDDFDGPDEPGDEGSDEGAAESSATIAAPAPADLQAATTETAPAARRTDAPAAPAPEPPPPAFHDLHEGRSVEPAPIERAEPAAEAAPETAPESESRHTPSTDCGPHSHGS